MVHAFFHGRPRTGPRAQSIMRRSSSSIYRENRALPPARSFEVQTLLWSEKAASKNPTTANIPQKPKRLAGRSMLLVHLYPPIKPIRLMVKHRRLAVESRRRRRQG